MTPTDPTPTPILDWFLEVLRIRTPGLSVTCCADLDCGDCDGCRAQTTHPYNIGETR